MRNANQFLHDSILFRDESKYDSKDYRSYLYKRDWVKPWIEDVSLNAVKNGNSIYENMWEMSADIQEHLPNKLFKFFPFTVNSLKCIEFNKIYLNSPDNFNDPYDASVIANKEAFIKYFLVNKISETKMVERGIISSIQYDKLKSVITKRSQNPFAQKISQTLDSVLNSIEIKNGFVPEFTALYNEAVETYNSALCKLKTHHVRVASFSSLRFEQLDCYMELWGHYADNHKGFCVEYDLENEVENSVWNKIVIGSLLPCNYLSKQPQVANYLFYKYAMGMDLTINQRKNLEKTIINSTISKSSSWSYENEWRLFLPEEVSVIYGNMIPFFPIKAIYVGNKMQQDDKEYLYYLCKRKGYEVCQMDLGNYFYELDEEPINVDSYFGYKKFENQIKINELQYEILKDDPYNHKTFNFVDT